MENGRDGFRTVDGVSPSEIVVREVAAKTDTDPLVLPPLYESIDPDALDALFESADGNSVQVEFEYAGRHVVVDSSGRVGVSS
jgi:hypothetical protein